MGTVARHSGAPYVRGEILDGTNDLEVDINNIVTAVNGGLDNSNITAAANIAGTKLANNTIPTAKYQDDSVTVAKMAATAVPSFALSTGSTTGANLSVPTSSYISVPGISSVSVTPGTVGDLVTIDFTGTVETSDASSPIFTFAARINGADTVIGLVHAGSTASPNTVHCMWAFAATSTSPVTVEIMYKSDEASRDASWPNTYPRVLLVKSIPIKA